MYRARQEQTCLSQNKLLREYQDWTCQDGRHHGRESAYPRSSTFLLELLLSLLQVQLPLLPHEEVHQVPVHVLLLPGTPKDALEEAQDFVQLSGHGC